MNPQHENKVLSLVALLAANALTLLRHTTSEAAAKMRQSVDTALRNVPGGIPTLKQDLDGLLAWVASAHGLEVANAAFGILPVQTTPQVAVALPSSSAPPTTGQANTPDVAQRMERLEGMLAQLLTAQQAQPAQAVQQPPAAPPAPPAADPSASNQ